MSYKRLNIKNGDVINDYHINYLQDAISKISSESTDFKKRLALILADKGISATKDDSFEDLLLKVNRLSRCPEVEEEKAWPDIRKNIQSKHIRLLFKSGAACKFQLELSSAAYVTVNWGDNTIDKYFLNKSNWIEKAIDSSAGEEISEGYKVVTIDISLDTEDSSIIRFVAANHTGTKQNLLWFCSKDIIFTSGYGMFNGGYNYGQYSCEKIKYIDFIGGGITGSLDSFAWGCTTLERVTGNLSPVGAIANAFRLCKKLKQLPPLDLNDITAANNLFYQCESLTEFNYYIKNNGTITNATSMFDGCINLQSFVPDQKFNFSNATAQNSCFANCSSLLAAPTITFGSGPANSFFEKCTLLTKVQNTISANNATLIHSFFKECASLVDGPSTFYANNATEAYWLFYKCSSIKTVPTVLSLNKATSAYSLFEDCYRLEKAPTTIDLPVATNIYYMFRNCNTLKTAPVTIRADLATQAYGLFEKCTMLTTAPELNLPAALRVDYMFDGCSSLISGPNRIHAPNATNALYFFRNCSMLQNPGTRFEIGNNVTNCDFGHFFYGCSALTSLPTEGDMHQGASYRYFFAVAKAVNLPLDALNRFCDNKGLSFPNATNLEFFADGSNIRKMPNINIPQCSNIQRFLQNNALLETVGDIYAPVATSTDYMIINSGSSLTELGKLTLDSATSNYLGINSLTKIKNLTIENLRMGMVLNNAKSLTSVRLLNYNTEHAGNLEFYNCSLDTDALDTLLEDLPDRNNKIQYSINIKQNPGSLTCKTKTGTDKNWKVIIQ